MPVGVSLQVSYDIGGFKCNVRPKQSKIAACSNGTPVPFVFFPSFASREDVCPLKVSRTTYKPFYLSPCRLNVSKCRSFTISSSYNGATLVKNANLVLRRSYEALSSKPLVLQLVSAAGVAAFAIWRLGPLIHNCRNFFLGRKENNWRKSRAYYVFTAYIQPLMLWSACTLICRAFDPVVLHSETSQIVKQRVLNFVKSLSTVVAFAYCISSLIQQIQKYFMESTDVNDARNMGFQFAGKAVYTAVWVAAISLFMELLGFSTQKWLTAGGLGTVLLTLAGREIFTNFLSSVMIHATRPFVVNEWIQTKIEGYEVSGTVEHVGWWSPTIIRGEDREAVHIPNHKFTVNVVRNISQKTHWRIKTHLAISHLDVGKINTIVADMRKVLAKNPQVEQQRLHRRVFLDNIDRENQALLILVSCFVRTSHFEEYLCVKEAILLDLLRVISHHRARLATPIRTVQKISGDSELENIPFSETVFTRSPVSANRPYLLVEPPSRINGNDKAKARLSRGPNEEQPPKTAEENNSDPQQQKKSSEVPPKGTQLPPAEVTQPPPSRAPPHGPISASKLSTEEGAPSSPEASSSEKPPPAAQRAAALEDNIVLGVALEGSKRILPIEEGMWPSASSVVESKDRNGKEGHPTATPSTPSPSPAPAAVEP